MIREAGIKLFKWKRGWNVSHVVRMDLIFLNANDFNQDLSGWCVFGQLPSGFSQGSALISDHLPVWGICLGQLT